MATVMLTTAVHTALQAAVGGAGDREFIAALGGVGGDGRWLVQRLLPLTNRATAIDRFDVDPLEFAAAEHTLRRGGGRWLGFVHSHPHGELTPSATDRAHLWRACLQLIAGTDAAAMLRLRAYRFDGARCDELTLYDAAAVRA